MKETYELLLKICRYVQRSRKYKSIYVKVSDRELFSNLRHYIFEDIFGNDVIVEARMTCFGKSKSIHKCYMSWVKHPTKTGKPVSTIDLEILINNLDNSYE